MNRVLGATAILALVLPLAQQTASARQAASEPQDEERVNRVVPVAPGGRLSLHNFSGRVTITAADRTDVAIEAVRRAPRERLARIALDIEAAGGNITIEANKRIGSSRHPDRNNVVETTFEIEVPRGLALDLDVFSSPVRVTGVQGRTAIKTFSGPVEVHGAAAAVSVETFSGAVRIDWLPEVVSPEVTAETFSGDIELQMPPSASGSIDIGTFSGDIRADRPVQVTDQQRRGLKGSLGGGGSSLIRLKTFSGEVILR
ncbi:MAG: DUF4097 family beta strand repeat-containing protein [Vicinamibacterales bacterium]